MDHEPFALRGEDQTPEWWIVVAGRWIGPWDNKGAAQAGYATELRRQAKRAALTDNRG